MHLWDVRHKTEVDYSTHGGRAEEKIGQDYILTHGDSLKEVEDRLHSILSHHNRFMIRSLEGTIYLGKVKKDRFGMVFDEKPEEE